MAVLPKTLQLREELTKIETGYGLMSLTWRQEPIPKPQAFAAMHRVIEVAHTRGHKAFFNIGEFYGPNFINLNYVKDFFAEYPNLRKDVIICCKGAYDSTVWKPTGKREEVIRSVENCTTEMGGYIDLFEVARLDTSLCTEGEVYPYESFEALAEMVENGAIGAFSLSEVDSKQIQAISKDWIQYLVCVEVELSLFSPSILTDGIADTANELGLVTVAYSPLGRGFLTGSVKSTTDIPKGDFRLLMKRFQDDNIKKNMILVEFLKAEILGKRTSEHPITLPQVALGWIRHFNEDKRYSKTHFLPIPSASTMQRVNENFDEERGKITNAEFQKINDFLTTFHTAGGRDELVEH